MQNKKDFIGRLVELVRKFLAEPKDLIWAIKNRNK